MTSQTIQNLIPTFDALKPALAADYVQQVTKIVERLCEQYSEREMRRLSTSYSTDGTLYRAFRYHIIIWDERRMLTERGRVNHQSIAIAAQRYADEQIAAFTSKLTKKLGDLTEVEIRDIDIGGFQFFITGRKGDAQVRVEQSRIINFSKLGKPYHQWPAIIYVDGKKVSEAAFKKLAA